MLVKKLKSLSRVRLCDCSLPGPSGHGISQARVLEWVAISFANTCERVKFFSWKKMGVQGVVIS